MSVVNAAQLQKILQDRYLRYYDSAFPFADPALMAERASLLRAGQLAADALIEPLAGYESAGLTFDTLAATTGLGRDVSDFVGHLFDGHELYRHQQEAFDAHLAGRQVALATGTGSGKTEAFLMPLLSALVIESRSWQGHGAPAHEWWTKKSATQRQGETGRQAGLRGIILYPMNALVEDQLVRMRRALTSDSQLQWLDANRHGHRFYFGRYTGQTPDQNDLPAALREITTRAARAKQLSLARSEDLTSHLSSTLGAEMVTRPDMQAHAPDILVTNYSMLNVMLSRSNEEAIFAQTAELLRASDATFHLVVDELHGYIGTAGTEVALLLRRLLDRIGLAPDSPKLRILAASASLGSDNQKALRYLEEFFGVSKEQFSIVRAHPRLWPTTSPWTDALQKQMVQIGANAVGSERDCDDEPVQPSPQEALDPHVVTLVQGHLLNATTHDGTVVPTAIGALGKTLFPAMTPEAARDGVAGVLEVASGQLGGVPLPVRAHLFFRNLEGWWACSDPECSSVPHEYRSEGRTIGRLYTQPTIRCHCGSRCLDLWICQTCGEHLLGGYTSQPDPLSSNVYLVPESPDLEAAPDSFEGTRTHGRYQVFWPSLHEPVSMNWKADHTTLKWAPACLDTGAGRLSRPSERAPNGWVFRCDQTELPVSALPTRCPNCDDNWEKRSVLDTSGSLRQLPITSLARMRTPISRARVSPSTATQVLTRHLLDAVYETPNDQRLVVFSDSRQDAARITADIDLGHYRDTVRQIVTECLERAGELASNLQVVERYFAAPSENHDKAEQVRAILERSEAARALRTASDVLATDDEKARARVLMERERSGSQALTEIRDQVFTRLLKLGRNPAGPSQELTNTWIDALDWSVDPPRPYRTGDPIFADIRDALTTEIGRSLFASGGRDLEGLGLGVVDPPPCPGPPGLSAQRSTELMRAVARVLGIRNFYSGLAKERDPDRNPPKALDKWLRAAARRLDVDESILLTWAKEMLPYSGQPYQRWVVQLDQMSVSASGRALWECPKCHWYHSHPSAGTCVNCRAELPETSTGTRTEDQDYYAWLAKRHAPVARLRCEELTGQTERQAAISRQARFQGIFLTDEPAAPNGIDLLSATTTMELGVDIGSLLSILLANMPPRRFNYQQRAGRAGRREAPLSVVLTVARERSHDQYYFRHTEDMTGSDPPPPYLCTDQLDIIARVVRLECLRRGFRQLELDSAFDGGTNVHGHFGDATDWLEHRDAVLNGISNARPGLTRLCDTLLQGTRCAVTPPTLLDQVLDHLDEDLRAVVSREHEEPALSQRLAEHGLLPMFGFPTQVRSLYTRRPYSSRPWPPTGAVDRDLWIAVSEFAPDNEIVLDKAIYRSTGVIQMRPSRVGRPVVGADPLGRVVPIAICDRCRGIDERPCPACRNCGSSQDYRVVDLAIPAGFRTNWRLGESYDGTQARRSRTSVPRLAIDFDGTTEYSDGGFAIRSGRTRLFVVNDNHRMGFHFYEVPGWDGLLNEAAVPDGLRGSAGEPIHVALGAARVTDVLIAAAARSTDGDWSHELGALPGVTGHLIATARRAAWTSLAFALRTTASRLLDIDVQEFETGLQLITTPTGGLQPQIFLADAAENGAGYVTWLAAPENFEALMVRSQALIDDWEDGGLHACDTSCYRCLRDYGNSPYHPILDWRLAADALEIVRYGHPLKDRWELTRRLAVEAAVRTFGDWECADAGAREPVIVTRRGLLQVLHPLRQPSASLNASTEVIDVFNLNRRPGVVYLAVV